MSGWILKGNTAEDSRSMNVILLFGAINKEHSKVHDEHSQKKFVQLIYICLWGISLRIQNNINTHGTHNIIKNSLASSKDRIITEALNEWPKI